MSEIMQDVLFNTDKPADGSDPAEFYELSLETEFVNGSEVFILRERHGWWNSSDRSVAIDEEGKLEIAYQSYRNGLKAYVERLNLHTSRRFLHSFIWHPANGEPRYNQKLEKR
jgi:hypothetical protein